MANKKIDWLQLTKDHCFDNVPAMLRELYRETGSLVSVGHKLGISPMSVRNKMVDLGIARKPRGK